MKATAMRMFYLHALVWSLLVDFFADISPLLHLWICYAVWMWLVINHNIVSLVLCRDKVRQHTCFRSHFNSFFTDLVTTLCFKDNSPPCSDIILHLLSLLMMEIETVPILGGRTGSLVCVQSHKHFRVYLWLSFSLSICQVFEKYWQRSFRPLMTLRIKIQWFGQ